MKNQILKFTCDFCGCEIHQHKIKILGKEMKVNLCCKTENEREMNYIEDICSRCISKILKGEILEIKRNDG